MYQGHRTVTWAPWQSLSYIRFTLSQCFLGFLLKWTPWCMRKKGCISAFNSQAAVHHWVPLRAGTQGRNTADWLAQLTFLYCPGVALTTVSWTLPLTSITNQEKAATGLPTGQSDGGVSRPLFPCNSSLCSVDKNKQTNQQQKQKPTRTYNIL